MKKYNERPLANYHIPFSPEASFEVNSNTIKLPHPAYQANLLPEQFELHYRLPSITKQSLKEMEIHYKPEYLTILTYNIWFEEHNPHIRYPAILRILSQTSADFICLQEVTPKFMELLAAAPFAQNYFMPFIKIDWYDTLILSRYPCRFYKKPFKGSQMERSLLMAVVEFAQKDSEETFKVGVNCVHLESSDFSGPKMQQIEEMKALNQKFDLSIIAGDFNFSDGCEENSAIQTYTDVWKSGKRHFSKWASEEMKEKGYTMPANQRNPAVRLDHIIYKAKQVQEKANEDEIGIIGDFTIPFYEKDHYSQIFHDFVVRTPSDHFGLIARLTI